MENAQLSKPDEIAELFRSYCKKHLDGEYLRLCNLVFCNLIDGDAGVFRRGAESVWAASIVWAVGSINFLDDNSIEPFASFADVVGYFNTKKSTVGQKASKIRERLGINQFTSFYLREDSPISDFMDNLVFTKEGLIVPRRITGVQSVEAILEEDDEKEELPGYHKIIIESKHRIKQAEIYQIEYLFKTLLAEDEQFKKIEVAETMKIHIDFYGRPSKIPLLGEKLNSLKYTVLDVTKDF